ncbi:MAG: hypothetical protein V4604_04500 [Bacteroidota bacterium]
MLTKMIGNKMTEARKKMTISQAQLAEHLLIGFLKNGKEDLKGISLLTV